MQLLHAVDVALVVLSVPPLLAAGYLGFLTLLSGRLAPKPTREPTLRFDFVVPAHDEEVGIADTVRSLSAVDYPEEKRRVLVVADNCKDETAERAREAGATVLERTDAERRGKGYALALAFETIAKEKSADAVVVVDADTQITPNLLRAFEARFRDGEVAVQAEYGVQNPRASWRTRLMVIAMALFHVLRSNARERLGVSSGLRGNGMGFSVDVLEKVPHDAYSIVEDVEYGIRLGEAGHRVAYVYEAAVMGEMVSSEKAARSQRRRWEAGRKALAKAHGARLMKKGLAARSLMLFDLGVDVSFPPLTKLVLAVFVGALASLAVALFASRAGDGSFYPIAWAPWFFAASLLFAYVVRGVLLAGLGARGFLDLLWAPVFIGWKLVLGLTSKKEHTREWVRTAREKAK